MHRLLLLATVAFAAEPGFPSPDTPHYDLEQLFGERELKEGLSRANVRLRATPDDATLMWMKVRFMFEIGELRIGEPEFDRLAWYTEMVDTAKRAVRLAPQDPQTRWWRGVAMGRLGSTRGVLASLFMANSIRKDFEATLESTEGARYATLDGYMKLPCDANYALSNFYRLVPERAIARALTGTKGGLDQALTYAKQAVSCDPVKVQSWLEMGAVQLCIGKTRNDLRMREEGLKTLGHARALPARNGIETIDHAHIDQMMANPDLACGYSRDGQQAVETAR